MSNRIYVVGFGPGDRKFMTCQAVEVLESADIIIGYTAYTDLIRAQFPDKEYISTSMRQEVQRCRIAAEEAMKGKNVAVISSGDSGIYGMAGLLMEVADQEGSDAEIITVPGITAASSSASVLGAPLMHDFAVISLSDLMTPLDLIMKRVEAAASADFIICFYNPRSKKRSGYLGDAAGIIMKYRSPDTPAGIVRNAGRPDESAWITTLRDLHSEPVDMFCTVIAGNSQTYVKNGKMITPRGYTNIK